MKKRLKAFMHMNLGVLLMSIGIYLFKIPNGFSTGGVSGVSTILGKISALTPAIWILIINAALLLVGFIFLGKKPEQKRCIAAFCFPFSPMFLRNSCRFPRH